MLIDLTPVQERPLGFMEMHENGLWADLERMDTGANNSEQE
jgi:hypothetical protein